MYEVLFSVPHTIQNFAAKVGLQPGTTFIVKVVHEAVGIISNAAVTLLQ